MRAPYTTDARTAARLPGTGAAGTLPRSGGSEIHEARRRGRRAVGARAGFAILRPGRATGPAAFAGARDRQPPRRRARRHRRGPARARDLLQPRRATDPVRPERPIPGRADV